MSVTVGIPAYNEAASIGGLLSVLLSDQNIQEVIVCDDLSNDGTGAIVEHFVATDNRVKLLRGVGREGQIAGWLKAANASSADTIVFMDADSVPERGAAGKLSLARQASGAAIVSGRIVPFKDTGSRASRFSAELLHHLRRTDMPAGVVIGRFFAVERVWLLENCTRTDIIANDAYLGCLAAQQGRGVLYVPDAVIRYVPPAPSQDFAAQRQRADAGYKQLWEMGLMSSAGPSPARIIPALANAAIRRPWDVPYWLAAQAQSRFGKSYYEAPLDGQAGIWQTQASTKRTPEACE